MNSGYIIDKTQVVRYLKWIEYVPSHWNVDQLEDNKYLKMIKEDEYYKKIFMEFLLNKDSREEVTSQVKNYMASVSIDDLFLKKLTDEELKHASENISLYRTLDDSTLQLVINGLKNINILERSMINDYVLYNLEIILKNRKVKPNLTLTL